MLERGGEIAIPPESYFPVSLEERHGHGAFEPAAFTAELRANVRFRAWELPSVDVSDAVSYPDAVRAVYAAYADARGLSRYGDKTPPFVLHMDLLAGLFPEGRFVHLIRDGRDVARSLVQTSFGPKGLARAAEVWERRVSRGRASGARLGADRYLEVRYESLVADPASALREVCAFVELGFREPMLHPEEGVTAVPETERAHQASLAMPVTAGLRDWRRDMPDADVALVEAVAGDLLSDLGYERRFPGCRSTARARAAASRVRFERDADGAQGRPNGEAMSAAPLFSVIVPTYGRPEYLGEAVASVLAQSVEDLEVIVVDDGSPEPAVASWEDARVRIVRRETNGGPAAARNTGLEAARGTYLTFCDDDDLFSANRLALAVEGFARAPVAICFNRYLDAGAGRPAALEGDVRDTVLDDMAPHLGRTALRRELAPRFDERFDAAEDIEWWLRLALADGVAVTTVPRIGYLVRRHEGVRTRTGLASRIRSRELLLDVHADYFASHPRARAFAWKRIGLMAGAYGDRAVARRAFARSLAARPEPKTFGHLASACRPSTHRLEEARA